VWLITQQGLNFNDSLYIPQFHLRRTGARGLACLQWLAVCKPKGRGVFLVTFFFPWMKKESKKS